ncbi:MAG: ribosome maturation factor [Balneolaceae bacterium]|nr:ribosome maturation factor [Balneolaceae bacterium]
MQKDITEVIKELSEPIIKQEDMFLVDVEVKHKKIPEVWVLVDSEKGGVNVDTCSSISRTVANLMEDENVLGGAYRLNVSSPGLSRPLSDKRQYPKNIGRKAKIKYKIENNYHTAEGVIEAVENELIRILDEENGPVEIEFNQIVETKIIPKI